MGWQPFRGRRGDNAYMPRRAVVQEVIRENPTVTTLWLTLTDQLAQRGFSCEPGQFLMLSLPHLGEAPISVSSPPDPAGFTLTVRAAGRLTRAVQALRPGDEVGVRGPYGRSFPLEDMRGHTLLVVAGGIGLAPLRPLIEIGVREPGAFSRLVVCYGARTPQDLCYRREVDRWRAGGVEWRVTVDRADGDWTGDTGLVTGLLDDLGLETDTRAVVCGPEVMIQAVLDRLRALGVPQTQTYTTLERHMQCGVGLCGHCHLDGRLVCVDGPVYRVDRMPDLGSWSVD